MVDITTSIKSWWKNPEAREQGQRLGFGLGAAMAFLGVIAAFRGDMERMENLALFSACLWGLALALPKILYPPAWIIEKVVKTAAWLALQVSLVAVFLIVFAPVGVMIRVLGKDPLGVRIDREAETYWLDKKEKDPASAERQF